MSKLIQRLATARIEVVGAIKWDGTDRCLHTIDDWTGETYDIAVTGLGVLEFEDHGTGVVQRCDLGNYIVKTAQGRFVPLTAHNVEHHYKQV